MDENEIIRQYRKHWNIEVMFKEGMMKLLGVTETQIQSVVDYVVSEQNHFQLQTGWRRPLFHAGKKHLTKEKRCV